MKRYDPDIRDDARGNWYGTYACMSPSETGDYVLYSDALASQAADKERIEALQRALINMADTWAHYRKCFEHVGAGDAMTGRAWMLCTRAETKARSALGSGGDEKEGKL